MTCQHTLFASQLTDPRSEAGFERVWFQPIVDTFEHRILAHECLFRSEGDTRETIEGALGRALAIRSAASQSRQGLYFFNLIPSSIDDPERGLHSTIEAIFDSGMNPGNVVIEVVESDLARDAVHSHSIREYLRGNGFGFAMGGAGLAAGADSFRAAADFEPDYINLDSRLSRNFDHPVCAPAISKLVRMAEKSGARVIAEGVDRVRMVENLWLLGVRLMEGHLFGGPAPHIA
jgi:EAL domain-containing protein (putative c-di-GMP-specific phosphodiesterase class I)